MITIPLAVSDSEYVLFIILTQKNIDRVVKYDGIDLDAVKYSTFMNSTLKEISIRFANDQEEAELRKCTGKKLNALEFLEIIKRLDRGWTFNPNEDGVRPILGLKQN